MPVSSVAGGVPASFTTVQLGALPAGIALNATTAIAEINATAAAFIPLPPTQSPFSAGTPAYQFSVRPAAGHAMGRSDAVARPATPQSSRCCAAKIGREGPDGGIRQGRG